MTLNNLGTSDSAQNRLDEARAHYEEALEDYRALADKNPDTCLPYLAMVLDNLGILDRHQNRLDQARAHLSESFAIFSALTAKDPERFSVKKDEVAKALASMH